MKKIIIILTVVVILFQLPAVNFQLSSAAQADLTRIFTLETTFDPHRYATLRAEGDTIHAEGFFRDEVVEDFYITPTPRRGTGSFTRNGDGSFTASFSGSPADSNALAVIHFEGGRTLSYRIEYTAGTGWFFGDNGLAASTSALLENYRMIPLQISENYISATLCPDEIEETRNRLREITEEVTAGLDCNYQIAKALNRWVADNLVYDRDAANTEVTEETVSIARTLRLGRSVCIGIANTYAALLETAGIKALNIKGGIANAREGVPYELLPYETIVHEWVAFRFEAPNQANSRWVWTDPTWDRQGFFENGNYHHRPSVIKHFDISPLALSFDHRGDRAELRQFLPVNNEETMVNNEIKSDDAEDDDPDVPYDDAEVLEIGQTESSVTFPMENPEENYILFYIIIGMLLAAIIIMSILILKLRR